MPSKLSSATFDISVAAAPRPLAETGAGQNRFTLVVMGDFTGRANRGLTKPLSADSLVQVDCDKFERVLAQAGARLALPAGDSPAAAIDLPFASLDDFHPDRLLSKVAPLARLVEARRLVLNPSTAEQGRTALQALLGSAIASQPGESGTADSKETGQSESDDDTLGRLLGGPKPAGAKPASPPSKVQDFIRQVVAPGVKEGPASWQQGVLSAVDIELAKQLRVLLHQPDFQSLEATWRGVDFLLRRIEAVEEIPVYLLDASAAELQNELLDPKSAGASSLLRVLRDRGVSVIVGNYLFGRTADDLRVLGAIAEIAAALGAPFIATASPRLVGCESFGLSADPDDWTQDLAADVEAAWQTLRSLPQAVHVGLAAPRFLLRQPYGNSGETIESFSFEELPGEPEHDSFLWGHPGILCACVMADLFQRRQAGEERGSEPAVANEVGELPVHRFTERGETVVKAYAEAWLTERGAHRMASRGVMPVLSRKDYNSVMLPSLNSLSNSNQMLPFGSA